MSSKLLTQSVRPWSRPVSLSAPPSSLVWALVFLSVRAAPHWTEGLHRCAHRPFVLTPRSPQVAESLGITEGFLRKRETHTDGVPHTCSSHGTDWAGTEAAVPRKRESEVGVVRRGAGAPRGAVVSCLELSALLQEEEVSVCLLPASLSCLGLVFLERRGGAGLSEKDQEGSSAQGAHRIFC